MGVNCQRCGTRIADSEWFCSFCGMERATCPDCGAEMDDEKCKVCNSPRGAPCGNCGLMIPGTVEECPECSYDAIEEEQKKQGSRKKKALKFGAAGLIVHWIVAGTLGSVVPFLPGEIAFAAGLIVGGPIALWGIVTAYYFNRQENKAEDLKAADLSKGRERNKSKQWRQMEHEERKEMLKAAAEGIKTAGKAASAYEERKKKQQKEQKLDQRLNQADEELTKAQKRQQEAAREKQLAQQKQQQADQRKQEIEQSVADVPKACPRCKEKWRGSGGMLSGKKYEELAPGRFQCQECGETVNLG